MAPEAARAAAATLEDVDGGLQRVRKYLARLQVGGPSVFFCVFLLSSVVAVSWNGVQGAGVPLGKHSRFDPGYCCCPRLYTAAMAAHGCHFLLADRSCVGLLRTALRCLQELRQRRLALAVAVEAEARWGCPTSASR